MELPRSGSASPPTSAHRGGLCCVRGFTNSWVFKKVELATESKLGNCKVDYVPRSFPSPKGSIAPADTSSSRSFVVSTQSIQFNLSGGYIPSRLERIDAFFKKCFAKHLTGSFSSVFDWSGNRINSTSGRFQKPITRTVAQACWVSSHVGG